MEYVLEFEGQVRVYLEGRERKREREKVRETHKLQMERRVWIQTEFSCQSSGSSDRKRLY